MSSIGAPPETADHRNSHRRSSLFFNLFTFGQTGKCHSEEDCCGCKNVPEGYYCKPDADTTETDINDVNGGCERYRFVSGIDETAMSCEIGLYFDFEKDIPLVAWMISIYASFHLLLALNFFII